MKLLIVFITTMIIMICIKFFCSKNSENLIKIYLIILCICFPFNIGLGITNSFMGEPYLVGVSYIFIVILCAFLTSINIRNIVLTKIDFLFWIFFVLIALNFIFNNIYEKARFLDLIIVYLSLYFLYCLFEKVDIIKREQIMSLFSYIAIINGVLSIIQYVLDKKLLIGSFSDSIIYTEGLMITKRSVGLVGTNNAAGNLAALLFAVCLYNYLLNKKKIDLIAIILTLIASALTLTRISYFAIGIEIIIYFFVSNWNSLKDIISKFKIIILIGLPTLIVFLINIEKIINILFIQRGNTQSYRFKQYNNVIDYCFGKINLFNGIGIGQYRSYISNVVGIREIDLHSQVLNILVEQGWISLIIFVSINLILYFNALKVSDSKLKKAFLISLFWGNLLCSNFNPNQYYYINNVIYIILIYININIKGVRILV